jgi:ribosomal protein S18 acetylase RimI-like enzyme
VPSVPTLPIRALRADDRAEVDRIYEICLRTGDSGADGTDKYADPRVLGEIYAGPYVRLAPRLAFVLDGGPAETGDVGGVRGYVLGVADTAAWEDLLEAEWWPAVRERYPTDRFPVGSADAACVATIHRPPRTDPELLVDYPAHLHIDLLPDAQGGGNGRRLIERVTSALREAGARGVHLDVALDNVGAQGFYEHVGFERLPSDGGVLFGMRL